MFSVSCPKIPIILITMPSSENLRTLVKNSFQDPGRKHPGKKWAWSFAQCWKRESFWHWQRGIKCHCDWLWEKGCIFSSNFFIPITFLSVDFKNSQLYWGFLRSIARVLKESKTPCIRMSHLDCYTFSINIQNLRPIKTKMASKELRKHLRGRNFLGQRKTLAKLQVMA